MIWTWDNFIVLMLMLAFFILGIAVGLTLAILINHTAFGQTSTITVPTSPSGIQFAPQQGYIVTIPPTGIEQEKEGFGSDLSEILISLVSSGAAFMSAKFLGDRNHKSNVAEILKGKENTKELARVTYDMLPEQSSKINDAPTIKIQTLQNDVTDYAQKTAKK